jgi:hypothetical protein
MAFSGDELELNFIGYALQQAAEFAIKHFMEINGVRYEKTHQIEDLLDSCESKNVPVKYTEEFYNFAPAISKWESKTQYIKNYVLARKQLEKGMGLIREFFLMNGSAEKNLMPRATAAKTDELKTF